MKEQPIQRPKPGRIGVYLVHGGQLAAECRKCRHWRWLDMEMLAERLGRDHSTLAPDLAPDLAPMRLWRSLLSSHREFIRLLVIMP